MKLFCVLAGTICLCSFGGINALHESSPGMDLRERFYNEAPEEWRKYSSKLEELTCEIQYLSYAQDGTIRGKSLTKVLHRDGEIVVSSFTDDGKEEVNGLNADYSFRLKKNGDQPYVLDRLPGTDLKPMRDIGYAIMNSTRTKNPTWLFREPLEQIIHRPYFKLLSIREASLDGFNNLALVEFDYSHPYERSTPDRPFNWVQHGRMWLDIDNSWVIVRFVGELTQPPDGRVWNEVTWEYSNETETSHGIKLPSIQFKFDLADGEKRSPEFNSHSFTYGPSSYKPPKKKFRLINFGINEPSHSNYSNSLWPLLWKCIGIGFAFLLAAWFLRRNIKKSTPV